MIDQAANQKARRGTAWKRLLLCAVTLLVCLVAVEVVLRIQHGVALRRMTSEVRAIVESQGGTFQGLGFEHSDVPGLYYQWRPGAPGVNSQGYLDHEHALKKPPGTYRIVVIGDSVAQGQNVDQEQSFPHQLEHLLEQAYPGRDFEVIVLARSGYSTSQELVLLRREAKQYSPDVILWSYVLNDPADPLYYQVSGGFLLVYRPTCHLGVLLHKARLGLIEWLAGDEVPTEFHRRIHHLYRDVIVRAFNEIGAFSRENDIPVAVVIHPLTHDYLEKTQPDAREYPWWEVHRDLTKIAWEAGLDVIDIQEAYEDEGVLPSDVRAEDDAWHPNALGHDLAARHIFRRLVAMGLLPPLDQQ